MSFLCVEHVGKSFAGTRVLEDVCLAFEQGRFITVLGPSGCGKTTLLNILSGIERPDSGRLVLNGEDITRRAPERRNFGMVFQNYALFPNLTVVENIAYGLRGPEWTRARRRERVEELMKLSGLSGLENRRPAELSGGQQQRVALGRALAPRPSVLLLDEPLSALDAQVRLTLGQKLRRIQRATGVTAIMVTHDQQEALSMADHIVLLHQGRVVQAGSPESIYTRPRERFAAEFIGHMNVVTLPEIRNGGPVGLRYEDVLVRPASERVLRQPHTWVGRVEHSALMGPFYRLQVLLNDFSTRLYADVARVSPGEITRERSIVAVTLPEQAWHSLDFEDA